MCDVLFDNFVTLIGSLILLPIVLIGFTMGWLTIAAIGVIIYVGFPMSAIFLDTIRWISNRFKNPSEIKPDEEATARLKKAAKIFIYLFETMGDLKSEKNNTDPLIQSLNS